MTNISQSSTCKMAAKINWHRYGTKLLHRHPMYVMVNQSYFFYWSLKFHLHISENQPFPNRQCSRPTQHSRHSLSIQPRYNPLPCPSKHGLWPCAGLYPRCSDSGPPNILPSLRLRTLMAVCIRKPLRMERILAPGSIFSCLRPSYTWDDSDVI